MHLLRALLCCSLLLIGIPALGQSANVSAVALEPGKRQIEFAGRVEYLQEQPELSFEQAAANQGWRVLDQASLDRSLKHLWLRFDIQQPAQLNTWYLMLRWPVLDEAVLRLRQHRTGLWSEPMRAGDTVPLSERPISSRHLVFPLPLETGEPVTAYLKVSVTEPVVLPLEMLDAQTFTLQARHELALISLFFGGILVILLYNISLCFFTRDLSYLFYSIYLATMVGYALCLTGLGPLFIWTDATWAGIKLYGLAASAAFLTSQLFARRFLDLPGYGGWPLQVNNISLCYWAFQLFSILFIPQLIPSLHTQTAALLSSVAGLAIPVYLWMRGNHAAKLFTLAWASLIGFTLIHLLALEGKLPLNAFTLESQLIGIFVEFILLSMALAGRINRERGERIRAQQAVLESSRQLAIERGEKLQAQQRALEIQLRANEALECRVQERTQALEKAKRGLEQANAQLEHLSIIDPLTQLYNRRHFDNALQAELLAANSSGQPLSLLMLDIDRFKRLNDNYGHPFGDECLRAVGLVLHSHTQRQGEIAARYGGEEFVALLPAIDQAAAIRVAERIRLAISGLRAQQNGTPVVFSASIGVASQASGQTLTATMLIKAADDALYAAKQGGRNRVVAADDPLPQPIDPLPS